jgi:hypothetical protein
VNFDGNLNFRQSGCEARRTTSSVKFAGWSWPETLALLMVSCGLAGARLMRPGTQVAVDTSTIVGALLILALTVLITFVVASGCYGGLLNRTVQAIVNRDHHQASPIRASQTAKMTAK